MSKLPIMDVLSYIEDTKKRLNEVGKSSDEYGKIYDEFKEFAEQLPEYDINNIVFALFNTSYGNILNKIKRIIRLICQLNETQKNELADTLIKLEKSINQNETEQLPELEETLFNLYTLCFLKKADQLTGKQLLGEEFNKLIVAFSNIARDDKVKFMYQLVCTFNESQIEEFHDNLTKLVESEEKKCKKSF